MRTNKVNRSVYLLASDFSTDLGEHFIMSSDKDGILYLKISADWDGKSYGYYDCFSSHDIRTMFVRARRSIHQYWFKKYGHYIWVKSQHLDSIKGDKHEKVD